MRGPGESDHEPPAAQLASPAISLQGVTKRYGSHAALEHLDLEVDEGEFFCLLGPSGCGKTTTLNLIGGFVAPSGGEIRIRGERVDALPPHRRDVNTVFQAYALFPHMTVEGNVGFGLRMARVDRRQSVARVAEALEMVGLEGLAGRLPGELSGGQQQRVAVARALINRPAVLLLDEPLGALDLKLRKRLQLELAELHREVGTVFVYVTHDQEEALALADRIAVMRAGRIEQVGSPREIYLHPKSRFVADFIGESNFFPLGLVGPSGGEDGVPRFTSHGRPVRLESTELVVMVRPEAILVSTGDAATGFLPGEVLHCSFLGNRTRVAIRCHGCSEPVLAEVQGQAVSSLDDLAPGRRVWISWQRSAAVVVDDAAPSDQPSISAESEEEEHG